ncbi:tryptophan 2,3-dioxygenase [Rhodothalassium salexigens DSM 2132]|uniref:Tryptophan 2,3-dioxygenase n=1 Tax=Rhodothalassium salexigens DSM 2132 TaxID=1188247 RepID=A0A4R2PIA5_RHOSA|nr:tryptophan 2,3-dioxygenase family protein [Rhodothalassium salexigens]MBB4211801.1 tryptophan 2,3-dioxygenase [Rhodothalassium salexigens DSM 2132]MBK1638136.1 tryptophan 2,3-dioxygenase [Rhodothalassium salexigens DSM 2132]TCP33901.1 tryptophan 2,3-dioxygenase [Rhodothalassium salexigens DSM 2132]
MDRAYFYAMMSGRGDLDYEAYLNTRQVLTAQKDFDALCNRDELQFQIVHQVEELWMKLVAYTLLDIDERIAARETNRALTLFARVHRTLRLMADQLGLLETMSPKEYQQIRLQLGNGSGQESPGFRTILKMHRPLWQSFDAAYVTGAGRTLDQIYDTGYGHDDAYMVAEAMTEFDELFQAFRTRHIQLIGRSIGIGAQSLKGRPVTLLAEGAARRFFPELWAVRERMTDAWGGAYGRVRDSLDPGARHPAPAGADIDADGGGN